MPSVALRLVKPWRQLGELPFSVWATCITALINRAGTMALVTDGVPPHRKRSAITLYRTAINLGMSFGPAIGGLLAAVSYYWVFSVDAVTTWMAALFLAWSLGALPPHRPNPDNARSRVL